MGEIYKITNKVNGKVCIGQTSFTTAVRWQRHLEKLYDSELPLYRAMRKYGVENFQVECLEECNNEKLDEQEIYHINLHDSFNQGYNCTLGGGGKRFEFDSDWVLQLWEEEYTVSQISAIVDSDYGTVKYYLASLGFSEEEFSNRSYSQKQKKVCQIDYHTREIVKVYDSGKVAAKIMGVGSSSHISQACRGGELYAYGYIWRFWDDISVEDKDWMSYSGDLSTTVPYSNFPGVRRQKVLKLCVETDVYLDCYPTITEAGESVSRGAASIFNAITREGTSAGFKWTYSKERNCNNCLREKPLYNYSPLSRSPQYDAMQKKVVQLSQEGEYCACYLSISDATEYLRGHRKGAPISKAVNHGNLAYGFKWKFCLVNSCDSCPY